MYKKTYKSNFSEYPKALNLSILNRTTWTKSKAFKSGRNNSNKCEKCDQEQLFLDYGTIEGEVHGLQATSKLSGMKSDHGLQIRDNRLISSNATINHKHWNTMSEQEDLLLFISFWHCY